MIPVDDFGALLTKQRSHVLPDPLGSITQHHHRPQLGRRAIPRVPLDHIQCSTARRLHAQAACEGQGWLARRHVARLLQMPLPPAARQANFDFVPVAFDRRAVEMPIAIAHHHPVGFDD